MTFASYRSERMKLVILIVTMQDLDELLYALRQHGHHATVVDESNGIGRSGNATLLIGVQEAWLFDLMGIIEETCRTQVRFINPSIFLADPPDFVSLPLEDRQGGATVFVLNVQRYERIA